MRQHPIRTGARLAAPVIACALTVCITLLPGGGGRGLAHAKLLNLNQIAGLSESDLHYGLTAAGLTPEALAAAGADDEKAIAVVAAAASYLGNQPSALSGAVTHLGEASAEVDRLERLIRRGGAVEPETLETARDDQSDAQATLSTLLASLRTTAMAPLSNAERTALNAIQPNLGRSVPTEFKLAERSESDWTALRDALANEAQEGCGIAAADQVCAAFLEAARNEDVEEAHTNLTNRLSTVRDAYNATIATMGE